MFPPPVSFLTNSNESIATTEAVRGVVSVITVPWRDGLGGILSPMGAVLAIWSFGSEKSTEF